MYRKKKPGTVAGPVNKFTERQEFVDNLRPSAVQWENWAKPMNPWFGLTNLHARSWSSCSQSIHKAKNIVISIFKFQHMNECISN